MFKDSVQTDLLQQDYTFYGESNYNYCAQDIRELLTERQPCTAGTDACSFKDQFIADVSSHKFLVSLDI
jgi:Golgi nucleoside diphosphatase